MSSTNKTSALGLNSWIGSDKPKMEDFNNDNELIDRAIAEHTADETVHITPEERLHWNSLVKTGIYFGDGSTERTIDLACDFIPSFAVIFASNRPIGVSRFSDARHYNYVALLSKEAASAGAKFTKDYKGVTVKQSASPLLQSEYANLNESGVAYAYVLFR